MVLFECQHASESLGELVKTQILGAPVVEILILKI